MGRAVITYVACAVTWQQRRLEVFKQVQQAYATAHDMSCPWSCGRHMTWL